MTWDRVYFKIEFFSLTLLVNHTTQKRGKEKDRGHVRWPQQRPSCCGDGNDGDDGNGTYLQRDHTQEFLTYDMGQGLLQNRVLFSDTFGQSHNTEYIGVLKCHQIHTVLK